MSLMNERIKARIRGIPYSAYPLNGESYQAKIIDGIDLIVKVNINIYDAELMNRDICRVVAHVDDGRLIVKRLEDGHVGIVGKDQVSYSDWVEYSL